MASVRLSDVTMDYKNGIRALTDLSLDVGDGDALMLIGEVGSGKHSTLRVISGLERPTKGDVFFDEINVTDKNAKDRNVAMLLRQLSVFGFKSVADNISYGLRIRKTPKKVISEHISEVAEIFGISDILQKRAGNLSLSTCRLMETARTFARTDVNAYLLCCPEMRLNSVHLDVSLSAIGSLVRQRSATLIGTTEDFSVIKRIGAKCGVMRCGRIVQLGSPESVFCSPANTYVASLTDKNINFFEGALCRKDGKPSIALCNNVIPLPESILNRLTADGSAEKKVTVGIRIDGITVGKGGSSQSARFAVIPCNAISDCNYIGERRVSFCVMQDGASFIACGVCEKTNGSNTVACIDTENILIFDASTGNTLLAAK